jgi:hypothetical protein
MILQSWMGPTSVGTSYGMCVIRGGKWNGSAAPSDALTALADDNGLLFVQSLTDTKFAVYADGHLGIGGNASHTDDLINVSYTPVDDTGANALQIAYSPYSTQSASYSYVGVNLTMTSSYVATGTTNSGTWIGIQANAYSSSANFAGTLTTMEGFEVSYGMNTGVGAATITNLYGIYLQGYYVTGTTVGNVYELYMGATTTGTLTGTHYGIYQVSTTGVNWFAKKTVIGASGGVTGSTFNTRGLVLNQTTYDDEILSLQSSDVAHALTALTDTATYGGFSKISATLGGLMIRGFSDGDGSGLSFRGYIGSTDPTDTMPAIALRAGKSDGSTGIALLGSTETVFSIMNLTRPVFNMLGYGTLQIGELDGYREATDEITATFGATVHGLSLAAGVAYYKAGVIDLSSYAGTEGSATRYLIRVHDSASKLAYGYIGAADAAETLSGSELVVNGNFETFTGTADDTTSDNLGTWTDTSNDGTGNHIWVLTANPAPHGGTYCVKYQRDSSTNAQSYQNFAVTAGKLYKVTFWTQGDGTNAGRYALYDVTAGATITGNLTTGVTAATWTQVTHYITAPAGCASMRLYFLTSTTAGSFFVVDDASVQEVTHVGATGVHIVSAINGSTRDWTSIESGFNYNDSAYTFEVMDTQLPIKILTTQVGYFDPFGLVLGAGGAGIDYRLKFDGETNDGVITWKEDENWFEFTRPIRMATSLYRRYYHMPVTSADPGASGATWVDPGANSTGGWQLNAAGETLVGQADVHGDWDGASDLQIEVRFYVNVDNLGGGAGDTVDLKGVVRYKGTGDTTVKSQTVEVPTTVGACAQYTAFVALITIDWDYAANVVEVGDNLSVVVNLETDTSEVDDVVITGLSFSYLTTHVGIENGDE